MSSPAFMFRPSFGGRVHQLFVDGNPTKVRVSKTAVGYSIWSREAAHDMLVLRTEVFATLPDAMAAAIKQWENRK